MGNGHQLSDLPALTRSPRLLLEGMAVLLLYVLLAHPYVYLTIWERRQWYVIILGLFVVPIVLVWSASVLVWRVKLSTSVIEIRSLRGVLKRQLGDLARVERTPGRILVAFEDGSQRTIPAIIGNLDDVASEIASRRPNCN